MQREGNGVVFSVSSYMFFLDIIVHVSHCNITLYSFDEIVYGATRKNSNWKRQIIKEYLNSRTSFDFKKNIQFCLHRIDPITNARQ